MDLARARLVQQRLIGTPHVRAEQVVAHLLAVQSQDHGSAKWGVAQRTASANDADVEEEYRAGSILRTHVLRPTWHFVCPADIRWLLELTAPRVHAVNAYYYRMHGMDAAAVKRSNAKICKALGRGDHLTRAELGSKLGEPDADAKGNRLACLIMRAELDGLIASGVPRGKQHTYALLDERAPAATKRPRDEALAELALRYVSGHGPAQAGDLAWWSGLTVADAKRGLEACSTQLERISLDGATYWCPPGLALPRRRGPVVLLLPNYDELLIAFKHRGAMLDPALTPRPSTSRSKEMRNGPVASGPSSATVESRRGRRVDPTSVLAGHFVVVDGRIVGGWRRHLSKGSVTIVAQLLRGLTSAESSGLERAAARYAKSLGLPFELERERVG